MEACFRHWIKKKKKDHCDLTSRNSFFLTITSLYLIILFFFLSTVWYKLAIANYKVRIARNKLTILTFLANMSLYLAILTLFLSIAWYKLAIVCYKVCEIRIVSQNCKLWTQLREIKSELLLFFSRNSDFFFPHNCEFISCNSNFISCNLGFISHHSDFFLRKESQNCEIKSRNLFIYFFYFIFFSVAETSFHNNLPSVLFKKTVVTVNRFN